jgi:thioredoxin reductase (NADPH)
MTEQVIIIGSGPAGLTAALYTARAQLEPLVFVGDTLGGQVAISSEIENYPGFPEGLTGPELGQLFQKQAERFGARLEYDTITGLDLSVRPFKVTAYSGEREAHALIIATGSSPRKLGVPGEEEFAGRGVSYCATCDGFFYTGREIALVGGGDAAVEEALFLTRFAAKIYQVHRRDRLRADRYMQERALRNERIEFVWDTVVDEIVGHEAVSGVRLRNVKTGEERLHPVEGVFVAIGHTPNTKFLGGQVTLDEKGYILTDDRRRTNVPGVYAAGDVQDWMYRQIATSVGDGCRAAMEVEKYIAELEDRAYPGESAH